MVNAKKKGNAYEVKIAAEFRNLGFPDAVTSRSESKSTDDKGVDLCGTFPLNVQCKAWERAPLYHDVLRSMPEDGINVIFHKKNRKGEVVVMAKDDFYDILRVLYKLWQDSK